MFRMTVKPWRDTSLFLGIGTYYLRAESAQTHRAESWVKVTLEKPLLLSAGQTRRLVERYGTQSPDAMAAMAGAWRLRRDILKRGHDGIIAIDQASRGRRITVVDLVRAGNPRGDAPGPMERRAAEISRLPRTELADER